MYNKQKKVRASILNQQVALLFLIEKENKPDWMIDKLIFKKNKICLIFWNNIKLEVKYSSITERC